MQKQKDEFVKNGNEIKISKDIKDKDINLNDVKSSINNLIYPKEEYATLMCPDCGESPFWILGKGIQADNKVRYYAICPKCTQIVYCYDESMYDNDVSKRIEKLTANNEDFKYLTNAQISNKITQMNKIQFGNNNGEQTK